MNSVPAFGQVPILRRKRWTSVQRFLHFGLGQLRSNRNFTLKPALLPVVGICIIDFSSS